MTWRIECGDALALLGTLADGSIDSLVTDPPAGIGFMGKDWDKDKGGRDPWIAWLTEIAKEAFRVMKPGAHGLVWALPRTSHWTATALEDAGFEIRDVITHHFGSGFPKSLDASKAIDSKLGKLADREVVSTYTAGGNAGTSTADKGGTFVVGAPNSDPITLTRTKGATPEAQQWDGWGTALKPGSEHWILIRKPMPKTLAENLLCHGVGALNIDACRIATDWNEPDRPESWKASGHTADPDAEKIAAPPGAGIECHPGGRWPTNVVFTHSAGCRRVGERSVERRVIDATARTTPSQFGAMGGSVALPSVTESVPTYDCADDCPVRALEEQSGVKTSRSPAYGPSETTQSSYGDFARRSTVFHGDTGTAARFFPCFEWSAEHDDPAVWPDFLYAAKPSTSEREAGCERLPKQAAAELTSSKEGQARLNSPRTGAGRSSEGRANTHPTVKGNAFMRWACRLVTPPGGTVLDIFAGSGSTGCAAVVERFDFIGFELDPHHCEIARARIAHWEPRQQLLFGETGT